MPVLRFWGEENLIMFTGEIDFKPRQYSRYGSFPRQFKRF